MLSQFAWYPGVPRADCQFAIFEAGAFGKDTLMYKSRFGGNLKQIARDEKS